MTQRCGDKARLERWRSKVEKLPMPQAKQKQIVEQLVVMSSRQRLNSLQFIRHGIFYNKIHIVGFEEFFV
jgi:hypothetical protein